MQTKNVSRDHDEEERRAAAMADRARLRHPARSSADDDKLARAAGDIGNARDRPEPDAALFIRVRPAKISGDSPVVPVGWLDVGGMLSHQPAVVDALAEYRQALAAIRSEVDRDLSGSTVSERAADLRTNLEAAERERRQLQEKRKSLEVQRDGLIAAEQSPVKIAGQLAAVAVEIEASDTFVASLNEKLGAANKELAETRRDLTCSLLKRLQMDIEDQRDQAREQMLAQLANSLPLRKWIFAEFVRLTGPDEVR